MSKFQITVLGLLAAISCAVCALIGVTGLILINRSDSTQEVAVAETEISSAEELPPELPPTPTSTQVVPPTGTSTTTPELTLTPTNTQVVPPTGTSTNTPVVPPTNTPTNTPVVLPTTIPTTSFEMQQYATKIVNIMDLFTTALTNMGDLLSNPRMGEDDWIIEVAVNIFAIRSSHEELTEITPPIEMRGIHTALLDATSDCDESMDYLEYGIDNLDIDSIEQANILMLRCGEKMEDANKLARDFVEHN